MREPSQLFRAAALNLVCELAIGVPLFAQAPSVPPNAGSPEKIVVLGEKLAEQIDKTDGRVQDPEVTAYVQKLADVLAVSPAMRLEVRLTGSSKRYAVLLPGRILYISSGLFLRAETEAELAALFAHEQSHTTSLHAIDPAAQKSTIVWLGDCVLTQAIAPVQWASQMRQSELRANLAAVELLRSKGYDPMAVDAVFSKLIYESDGWEKAMPSLDLDAVRTRAASGVPPSEGYVSDSSQFAALRELLESKSTVSSPAHGNVTLRRKP